LDAAGGVFDSEIIIMAITPIMITGFEHGALSANGAGLVSTLTGAEITVQSTVKRTGGYALRCNMTGAAQNRILWAVATPTYIVGSLYFYIGAYPVAAANSFIRIIVTSGSSIIINLDTAANSRIYARIGAGTQRNSGTIATGAWHRLDFRAYCGATTFTLDWQIDGADQTQATLGSTTATTFTFVELGSANAAAYDLTYDDVIISATSADYPIGAHEVIGLSPNADGTHNAGTNIIEDQAGADIGVVTAYDLVNSVPIGEATKYIKQTATDTSKYAEINFANINYATILGARALLAYRAAGTAADEGACIIIDEDATATTVWGSPATRADYSESSVFYKGAILPAPAGGWDKAAVDALKARVGYSNDVADVPYWVDLMIEVAHLGDPVVITLTVDNIAQAQTVGNAALAVAKTLAVASIGQAQTAGNVTVTQAVSAVTLTIQNAAQAQTVGNIALTVAKTLAVASIAEAQTVGNVALTVAKTLAVASIAQAQTVGNVVLVVNKTLAVQSIAQTQTVENVSLAVAKTLAVDGIAQAQTVENVVLGVAKALTVQGIGQAQTVENVVLSTDVILLVASISQAQTVENVVMVVARAVTVQDIAQAQTVENVGLIVNKTLTPANVAQAQTVENVTLASGLQVTVQNTAQAQTVENVSLTVARSVAPQAANQAQTVGNVTLIVAKTLVPANVAQGQSVENVDLETSANITPANVAQSQSVENVTLVVNRTLAVQNIAQSQTVGNVNLTGIEFALGVQNIAQAQTVSAVYVTMLIVIAWTLRPRSFAWTLDARSFELTLPPRGYEWTLDPRTQEWTLKERVFEWTLKDGKR
jgi:hypothetical protein